MNTDLKHYVYFSIGQTGKIIGSLLATALLARVLDPAGLGRWTMLIAAATFFHSLFANWLQQDPFLRFGKQEWIQSGSLRTTWSTRLPLLSTGVILAGVCFTVLWPWLKRLFELSSIDGLLSFAFFLSLVVTIDMQTLLQIVGRMDKLAWAPALISLALVPLYFILWLSDLPHHRVEISLLGTIALTVGIWFTVTGKDVFRTQIRFSGWSRSRIQELVRYAWPILPTALLGYLMNWGNQVLIHRFFTSYDVGLYQSAFQVHSLGVTMALPFTTILIPKLIDKHLQDPTAMNRFVESFAPTLFCLWLLVVIPGIAILPWVFVRIYGESFSAGLLPLIALLAGTPFCALGQIYTGLFTVQGKLGRIFWVILTMVAINFMVGWVLVPFHRITLQTIALAFSAAFVFAQFLVYFSQHRHLGVPSRKINGLVFVTLIFSVGECLLLPVGPRVLWSALLTLALVAMVRWSHGVDASVLKQLFSGRLAPVGDILENILVPGRKAAIS